MRKALRSLKSLCRFQQHNAHFWVSKRGNVHPTGQDLDQVEVGRSENGRNLGLVGGNEIAFYQNPNTGKVHESRQAKGLSQVCSPRDGEIGCPVLATKDFQDEVDPIGAFMAKHNIVF